MFAFLVSAIILCSVLSTDASNYVRGIEVFSNGCPVNNLVHRLLAHESDCSKFYHCSNGERILVQCPPGTLFDSERQICNFEANVVCAAATTDAVEDVAVRITRSTEAVFSNGCPVNNLVHRLLAHESDCSKFYHCSNGERILVQCPPGTLFDSERQICNFEANVVCAAATTDAVEDVAVRITRSTEAVFSNGCPVNNLVHRLLAHESDCSKFYHCSNGERILVQCPPGTLFDSERQICNFEANVVCAAATTDAVEDVAVRITRSTEAVFSNGCPVNNLVHRLLAHESDCSKFYHCSNGERILVQCPPGTLFDSERQICNFEANVVCAAATTDAVEDVAVRITRSTEAVFSNGCPVNNLVHRLLAHESDCSKFYHCSNGERILVQCPPGTLFDSERQICNFEANVVCAAATTDAVEDVAVRITRSTEAVFSNGCPVNNLVHRLLAHESDCSKFYHCSNGERILVQCPPGTLFDYEKQICNLEANVVCVTAADEDITRALLTVYNGNGCPKDWSIHVLLPHESDCSKFFQCSNGIKYLMSCAPGTYFNNEMQVCDHPNNVDCSYLNNEVNHEENVHSHEDEVHSHEDDVHSHEEDVHSHEEHVHSHEEDVHSHEDDVHNNEENVHSHEEDVHSHEEDVHTHEEDVHSHEDEVHSHEDDVHSHELNVHSHEEHVHSHEEDVHSHEDEVHSHEDDVHSHEEHVHSHEEDVHSHEDEVHSHEDDVHSHELNVHSHEEHVHSHEEDVHSHEDEVHSHEDDVHSHEEHVHSHEEDVHSHEDEVHSHEDDVHSHEENVHSHEENVHSHEEHVHSHEEDVHIHEDDVRSQEEDVHTHEEDVHSHENNVYSHEDDAHSHEEDVHSHEDEVHSHENLEHQEYDKDIEDILNYCDNCINDDEYWRHNCDCRLFYRCVDGKTALDACPKGLLFNDKLNLCDHPINVDCGNRWWERENESSGVDEINNRCRNCSHTTLYWNHECDCRLYYKCHEGYQILQGCPSRLYFNKERGLCDFPTNVECSMADVGSNDGSFDESSESPPQEDDDGDSLDDTAINTVDDSDEKIEENLGDNNIVVESREEDYGNISKEDIDTIEVSENDDKSEATEESIEDNNSTEAIGNPEADEKPKSNEVELDSDEKNNSENETSESTEELEEIEKSNEKTDEITEDKLEGNEKSASNEDAQGSYEEEENQGGELDVESTDNISSEEVSTTTEQPTEDGYYTVGDTVTESTSPTPAEEVICLPGYFGNVANPDDCKTFYFCSSGIQMQLSCQTGQGYDPELGKCVDLENIDC